MTTKEDINIDEKIKTNIEPPKRFKVVLYNDNVTPMELVIDILRNIFRHTVESAKEITLEIHNAGTGIAGVYTYEIAEELAIQATAIARQNGSPLKIQVVEE